MREKDGLKFCPKCNDFLDVSLFYKNKARSDGFDVYCKTHKKLFDKEKNYSGSEQRKEYIKQWNKKNNEKINTYSKKQRVKNAKKIDKTFPLIQECYECKIEKPITEFCKDKYSSTGFTYSCKECRRKRLNEYRQTENGKEKIRQQAKKRLLNPYYKLHHNISRAIHGVLNNDLKYVGNSILPYLPFSIKQLKEHLESLFEPWMNWQNWGVISFKKKTWQIDHVIPQSKLPYDSFDHPNFLKCWGLENLRPLEAFENIKKSNKILFMLDKNNMEG